MTRVRSLAEWRRDLPNPRRPSAATAREPFYVALGEIVREMRARLGKSQAALAAEIGVGTTVLCRIEQGSVRFPVHLFPNLAKALRLEVRDLFPPGFLDDPKSKRR